MSSTEPTPTRTTTSDEPDVRSCGRCGVENHPERLLCRSCGVDLDAPTSSLTVGAGPASVRTAWSGAPRGAGSGRSWALAVLAVAAVVAVVLGVLVVTEVGPFARTIDIPDAPFEAADYPDDPEVLLLTEIAALTTRTAVDDRTFDPAQMVDGDRTTAWHGEVVELPGGLDEKIDLVLDRPAWITALVIGNGDQRSADDYAAAGRVQRVELVFDGSLVVPVTLLDQGLESQIVELDEPQLTTAVRIEILATVPGTERDDPALSRVELRGHPATEDDQDLAEQRAEIRPAAGPIIEPT